MKKHLLSPALRQGALAIALIGLAATIPVRAQDAPQISNDDGRVTIVIEEGGRVFVNGQQVATEGGEVRIAPTEKDVFIMRRPHIAHPAIPAEAMRFHFENKMNMDEDWLAELEDGIAGVKMAIPAIKPLFSEARFIAQESAEVARLEVETHQIARQVRQAEGAERTRLEQELRDKLAMTLEKRQEVREERIVRLEEELQEQRELLQERQQNRNEIIERRLNELTGEEDTLDW